MIFSIGVVVGSVIGLAMSGFDHFDVNVNVNHEVRLPTGIVIGGPPMAPIQAQMTSMNQSQVEE